MYAIGLDVRGTEEGFKAHFGRGIGRYAAELITQLQLLSDSSEAPDITFKLIGGAQLKATAADRRLLDVLPFGRMTFESQFLFPRRIRATGVDLMHFFAHGDAPALCPVAQAVTVLDLIPLRFPELYRANKSNLRFRFARFLEYQAIRSARGILAISEATKRDVIELLGVAPEKVVVTPLAVADSLLERRTEWKTTEERRAVAQAGRHQLGMPADRPLLLYVGGIDPRKNVPFMLRVFADVLRRSSGEQRPLLVLAGRYEDDDQYPKLLKEARGLGSKCGSRCPAPLERAGSKGPLQRWRPRN